jgi:hypothetical protein
MSAAPVINIAASVKNRLLAAARPSGKPFEGVRTARQAVHPSRQGATPGAIIT